MGVSTIDQITALPDLNGTSTVREMAGETLFFLPYLEQPAGLDLGGRFSVSTYFRTTAKNNSQMQMESRGIGF